MLTEALVLFLCEFILEVNGESYRLNQSKSRQAKT